MDFPIRSSRTSVETREREPGSRDDRPVRRIRPTKRPVYLKLHFAPGECAQVDWGAYGTVSSAEYSAVQTFFAATLTWTALKAWPDRICIYFDNQLIARHQRHYGRHEDIEDPDHPKGLIAQRSRAREQRLMMRFLALSPDATAYYDGLEQRRLNARHHVRKILALAEAIYLQGTEQACPL